MSSAPHQPYPPELSGLTKPALSLGTAGEATREPHGTQQSKQSVIVPDEASTGEMISGPPLSGQPGKAVGHAEGKLTLRHDLAVACSGQFGAHVPPARAHRPRCLYPRNVTGVTRYGRRWWFPGRLRVRGQSCKLTGSPSKSTACLSCALKEHIEATGPASHALTQVRWVMSRFAAADNPASMFAYRVPT